MKFFKKIDDDSKNYLEQLNIAKNNLLKNPALLDNPEQLFADLNEKQKDIKQEEIFKIAINNLQNIIPSDTVNQLKEHLSKLEAEIENYTNIVENHDNPESILAIIDLMKQEVVRTKEFLQTYIPETMELTNTVKKKAEEYKDSEDFLIEKLAQINKMAKPKSLTDKIFHSVKANLI